MKVRALTWGGSLRLLRFPNYLFALGCLAFGCLLGMPVRVSAIEDPAGCSLASGGLGNVSQGGLNFALAQAHVGDAVPVFPSLGMASNACKAINATGSVYIATGLLTNFLVNVTLNPGEPISCPAHTNCSPGPYNILITPALVGAGVSSPSGGVPGVAKTVRAVQNGFGTVLTGDNKEQLSDFHSASITIVTPCLQVFTTCDLPAGQSCFSAGTPVRFRGYVTNCGDIALTNVTVMDDRASQLQLFDPTNGAALTLTNQLAPGDYAVFSNNFLPTLQEACAGLARCLVTATARDTTTIGGPNAVVTNSFLEGCGICAHPAIVVAKTCPPGAVAPGAVLTFSGMVTNTGDLTLTNVTLVADRLLADGSNLVASFATLTNGEFGTFTGSYVVPTNACLLTATLTAEGTTLCGLMGVTSSVTTTLAVTNTPQLRLTATCPGLSPGPGELFLFSGNLTNTGDVAVTNLVIVSSQLASNLPVTVVARLEPGEGVNYSGSYLVPTNECSLTATLTASGFDVCGASVTTAVTLTCPVADHQNPVITCFSNLLFAADAGQCSRSNVTFFVSASDNCGVPSLSSNVASGSVFPVGLTTVTNTATDASGNTSSCTFTVTVTDTENPVITCPSNLVLAADAGRCDRSNVTFTVSATDNCGVPNLVSSPASGSVFPVGLTTVTNTATDASGNTSSCTFTVTVTDTENPVITCPTNLVLAADAGRCDRSNVTFTVSATDNCGVPNLVSSPASGSVFPEGVTTVTNTATDASGNLSRCTFTVTVVDTQYPVITCPSNLVLGVDPGRCNRTNVTFAVGVTDNCSVTNLAYSPASGSTFPMGVTRVTCKAADASGNVSLCSFTVTVADTQHPVILCPSNMVFAADAGRCSRSNVTFTVSATDNCSVTNLVSSPASGSLFPVGVTTVTSKAADASGNVGLCSFTVTVTDTQKPVITCPGNLVLAADAEQCSRSNVTFTVLVEDNCGVASLGSSPVSGSTFPIGVTTVTTTALDPSGNSRQCTFTVTVLDQQPPVITCPPDIITNVAYIVSGLTNLALGTPVTGDNCGVAGVSNNAPAFFPVGTNLVVWTATDVHGNSSSGQQRVVVIRTCTGNLVATPLTNQTICPNLPLLFQTTATSPEPITYLWKFNGQPMAAQTSNSLAFPFVDGAAAGTYSVEVRTPCASVTNSATLSVLDTVNVSPASFTNSEPIIISEFGPSIPYGSIIAPQCMPGVVKKVTVRIYGFFHNFPADVSMALVGPDGHQVKLMAGAGGGEVMDDSVNLTFSDDAANPVPATQEIVSGNYHPSDYLPGVALPPPATGPYSNSLAAFIGASLNGAWRLCVYDGSPYDGGGIAHWTLDLDWRESDLRLCNSRGLTNGGFQFEVTGQAGIPTIIETSSDLVTWLPLATNVYATNPGVFTAPTPLVPHQFYRAVQP